MRRRGGLRALLAGAVLALAIGVAPAGAASDIEGVWTFAGGSVLVAADADGHLLGTVASATTFEICTHPVSETVWSDIRAEADGSYVGMHQWYRGPACNKILVRGPTAFRVVTKDDGSRLLRVCFNRPGTTVPSISTDGTARDVNFSCVDSQPIAGVPTVGPSFARSMMLPSPGRRGCLSRRSFTIHIRQPVNDPFVKVSVYLGDRLFKVSRGPQIAAGVNLRNLPKGRYTINIKATTAANHHVEGSRSYRTCRPARASRA